MLIKRKKLASKNGIDTRDARNVLLKNIKTSNKNISFASPEEIEDSLDSLYQDYSSHESIPKAEIVPVLSKEEIEAQAHDLIETRASELYAKFQLDVNEKRSKAEKEITEMLENARNKADVEAHEIVANASSQAERFHMQIEDETRILELKKKDFEEAMVLEKQKAYDEGMLQAEAHIAELVNILSRFNRIREDIIEEVKPQIASIAVDVAKQIIKFEADNNPDLIEEQVSKSVSKLINSKGVMQIYLNPEDVRHADYLDSVLSKLLDSSIRLIFIKDEAVSKGSCVINTQGGRLDASFSTQIELIKVSFEKYLGYKIDELDELADGFDSDFDTDFEELDMPKQNIIKPNKKAQFDEPSDDELNLLEDDPDALVDFSMDEDLDLLLQEVLLDDEDTSVKNKPAKAKVEKESFKVDHDDSMDIGANDFANGDDLDLDEELKLDDEPEMEEFNEFAGEDDIDNDSNFDDSQMDGRFPEY